MNLRCNNVSDKSIANVSICLNPDANIHKSNQAYCMNGWISYGTLAYYIKFLRFLILVLHTCVVFVAPIYKNFNGNV